MAKNLSLIFVDAETNPPPFAVDALQKAGMSLEWRHASTVERLRTELAEASTSTLILCNAEHPTLGAPKVVAMAAASDPSLSVIVLTSERNLGNAVDLVKAGAEDVIEKGNGERLLDTVVRLTEIPAAADGDDAPAQSVFLAAREAIMVTDADNRIVAVNSAFEEATGYAEEDVVGKSPAILSSGRQDKAFYRTMWDSIIHNGHWEGEIWNRRKNGELYPEWLSISVMRDGRGSIVRHIAIFSDISEQKRDHDKLHYRAHYDPLTGLPNRALGLDRLSQAIATAHRRGVMVAVMFVDLDDFKPVNDELGHEAGDALLCQVARRMEGCVRESDTVCRLGGDEFVVILTEPASQDAVKRVAAKISGALSEPVPIRRRQVFITASIGISFYPLHSEDAMSLVRIADEAMYAAKGGGKNRYSVALSPSTDAA